MCEGAHRKGKRVIITGSVVLIFFAVIFVRIQVRHRACEF